MSKKFNLEDYKGNYVMHCKTEEEANDFCRVLHEAGRTWFAGDSYLENNYFHTYKSETGYNFNKGMYANVDYHKHMGYIVLEWGDFMDHVFTKDDLRTGDLVMHRNGGIKIVIKDARMIIGIIPGEWFYFSMFDDDLNHILDHEFDIISVRRPTYISELSFDAFDKKLGELVYERDETVEMTIEEVCKALGKNVKIVKKSD